ncbi:hypothetical protein [Nitratireductor sp. GCM10026969]|uniref:hypothetical protein n=1 Tax=Nitratireductor sp. GCM10026969 TaxID=3252645 RepID=UPI003610EEB0
MICSAVQAFREKNAEFVFILHYAFRHNMPIMKWVSILLLLPFAIVLLPHDWLAIASNKEIFFAIAERFKADYVYLLENKPEFAEAYVGGVVIQLFMVSSWVIINNYLAITSNDKIYVSDKSAMYLYFGILSIFGSFMFYFISSRMSDFGLSTDISWFADNPDSRKKLVPIPTNSTAFIMSGGVLFCVALALTAIVQIPCIFFLAAE